MNIKEILVIILNYTDYVTIYCYCQTSITNKKIVHELIRTKMINVYSKHVYTEIYSV